MILFNTDEYDVVTQSIAVSVAKNQSAAEVTLSVGECLLMTIKACHESKADAGIIKKLKLLYLNGAKTQDDIDVIDSLSRLFLANKAFTVSRAPEVINADPSRRYFETHLASKMLEKNASALNVDVLKEYTNNLHNALLKNLKGQAISKVALGYILKGEAYSLLTKYQHEYAELINKLMNHDFYGLSNAACDNLCEIARSTIIATLITQCDGSMPVNVYDDSIFAMGIEGRGRTVKTTNDKVLTAHKGLMRSTNPVPRDDVAAEPEPLSYPALKTKAVRTPQPTSDKKPVALQASGFQRSADQSDFMIESTWSQSLFNRLTHVFSNGISSTTLAYLRNMILQRRLGHYAHEDNFQEHMCAFVAMMIYNSGGHSLFEIFEVFKIPQMSDLLEASGCEEFIKNDSLMSQWLYETQTDVFNEALNETIFYSAQLVSQRVALTQLKNRPNAPSGNASPTVSDEERQTQSLSPKKKNESLTLHEAVRQLNGKKFQAYLTKHPRLDLNQIVNGYTPLMLAAQIGHYDNADLLLKHRVDTTVGFKLKGHESGLTALELAIKSEHLPVVTLLLEKTTLEAKKNSAPKGSLKTFFFPPEKLLKNESPALYFSARQKNMGILRLILSQPKITLEDKTQAILETIKCENIGATETIFASLTTDELEAVSKSHGHLFLQQAVTKGNNNLFKRLLNTLVEPEFCFNELLSTANKKNYLPIAQIILRASVSNNNVTLKQYDLNQLMLDAVTKKNFYAASLAIAYGADPTQISMSEKQLPAFIEHLQKSSPEAFNQSLTKNEIEMIRERRSELEQLSNSQTTGWYRGLIDVLVAFFSKLNLVDIKQYTAKKQFVVDITEYVSQEKEPEVQRRM